MKYKSTRKPKLFTIALFVMGTLLINQTMAKTMYTENIKYNIEISLSDNLKNLVGKVVTIHLQSSEKIEGLIKAVNKDLLHLEKITGKEFYDSLIVVQNISSITMRYR